MPRITAHRRTLGILLVVCALASAAACTEDPSDESGSDTTFAGAEVDGGDSGSGTTETTDNPFCLDGAWPERVMGEPLLYSAYQAQEDPDATVEGDPVPDTSVLIWSTPFGIFVRFYDRRATPAPVKAVVDATGDLSSSVVKPDGTGDLKITGNTMEYTGTPGRASHGFNISVCRVDQVRITLTRSGQPIPASEIHLGRDSTSIENPVELQRA